MAATIIRLGVFIYCIMVLNVVIHELLVDIQTIRMCNVHIERERLVIRGQLEYIQLEITRNQLLENHNFFFRNNASFSNLLANDVISRIKIFESNQQLVQNNHLISEVSHHIFGNAFTTSSNVCNTVILKELSAFI